MSWGDALEAGANRGPRALAAVKITTPIGHREALTGLMIALSTCATSWCPDRATFGLPAPTQHLSRYAEVAFGNEPPARSVEGGCS